MLTNIIKIETVKRLMQADRQAARQQIWTEWIKKNNSMKRIFK
jgi:hypothetical protein